MGQNVIDKFKLKIFVPVLALKSRFKVLLCFWLMNMYNILFTQFWDKTQKNVQKASP